MQHQSCGLEPKPILKTREGDKGDEDGQEFMRDQGRSHNFSKGRGGQTVTKQRVLAFSQPEYCGLFASKRL